MNTQRSHIAAPTAVPVARASFMTWFWIACTLAVATLFAVHARRGVGSPRVANPEVTGAPRPVDFLFGWTDQWILIHELGTVVVMAVITALCVRTWLRQPGHPYVLMTIASTAIVWQDPIMNWAPYAAYNPQLFHLPEDWWLAKMSPTVEPFVVIGYALFYFGPFFPAMALLRRLQARAPVSAFVWRHPLWTLAGLTLVIGFLFDAALEISLVRTGLYIYTQVIPWGSLFAGTTFQFPLIWESALVCVVMVPAAVLCYRDDTGRTQAEKLVQRFRFMSKQPAFGTFVMMFAILNVAYFIYGGSFALIRISGAATAVACPWPFPESKVYDPQGYFEREGEPGPYFEGFWSTWASGQADGRPERNAVKPDGMCKGAR